MGMAAPLITRLTTTLITNPITARPIVATTAGAVTTDRHGWSITTTMTVATVVIAAVTMIADAAVTVVTRGTIAPMTAHATDVEAAITIVVVE